VMSPTAHFGHCVVPPPSSHRHARNEWTQTDVILGF
jgi:hypothetical protein